MKKQHIAALAALGLFSFAAWAQDLNIREFDRIVDPRQTTVVDELVWYAGESVSYKITARRDSVPVEIPDGTIQLWTVLDAQTNAFVVQTGIVVSATNGQVEFWLPAPLSNIPPGEYFSWVQSYQGTNRLGVLDYARVEVRWRPDDAFSPQEAVTNYLDLVSGWWAEASVLIAGVSNALHSADTNETAARISWDSAILDDLNSGLSAAADELAAASNSLAGAISAVDGKATTASNALAAAIGAEQAARIIAIAPLASTTHVANAIAAIVHPTNGLASTQYVAAAVSAGVANRATTQALAAAVAPLASTGYVKNAIAGLSNQIPSTNGLASTQYVAEAIAEIDFPPGGVSTATMNSAIAAAVSNRATTTQLAAAVAPLVSTTSLNSALSDYVPKYLADRWSFGPDGTGLFIGPAAGQTAMIDFDNATIYGPWSFGGLPGTVHTFGRSVSFGGETRTNWPQTNALAQTGFVNSAVAALSNSVANNFPAKTEVTNKFSEYMPKGGGSFTGMVKTVSEDGFRVGLGTPWMDLRYNGFNYYIWPRIRFGTDTPGELSWLLGPGWAATNLTVVGSFTLGGQSHSAIPSTNGLATTAEVAAAVAPLASTGQLASALAGYVKTNHSGDVSITGRLRIAGTKLESGYSAHNSTGRYVFVSGYNSRAMKDYSAAIGADCFADGLYSIAMGNLARAEHNNAFVWSDGGTHYSSGDHTFSVFARNGIFLNGPLFLENSGLNVFSVSDTGEVKATKASKVSGGLTNEFATTNEVAAAVVGLATTGQLAAAVAPLASTQQLAEAIAGIEIPSTNGLASTQQLAEAIAPLASTTDLAEAIAPLASTDYVASAVAGLTPTGALSGYLNRTNGGTMEAPLMMGRAQSGGQWFGISQPIKFETFYNAGAPLWKTNFLYAYESGTEGRPWLKFGPALADTPLKARTNYYSVLFAGVADDVAALTLALGGETRTNWPQTNALATTTSVSSALSSAQSNIVAASNALAAGISAAQSNLVAASNALYSYESGTRVLLGQASNALAAATGLVQTNLDAVEAAAVKLADTNGNWLFTTTGGVEKLTYDNGTGNPMGFDFTTGEIFGSNWVFEVSPTGIDFPEYGLFSGPETTGFVSSTTADVGRVLSANGSWVEVISAQFSGAGSTGYVTSTTADVGKVLSADGTWIEAPAGTGGVAYAVFAGPGTTGVVTSAAGETNKYLRGDGTWQTVSATGSVSYGITDSTAYRGDWGAAVSALVSTAVQEAPATNGPWVRQSNDWIALSSTPGGTVTVNHVFYGLPFQIVTSDYAVDTNYSDYYLGVDTLATNIWLTLPDMGTNFTSIIIRKFSNTNELYIMRNLSTNWTLFEEGDSISYDWIPIKTNWYWRAAP